MSCSQKSNRFTTKRLVTDALFAALYVVFSCFVTVKTPIVEISFASFPVIFSAFLLDPADAALIALTGSFIEQMMFGLSPTAPLWMLPPILQGLTVGLLASLTSAHPDHIRKLKTALTVVLAVCTGELILTAANTGALYLDGFICGYPVKALHLIVVPRICNCAVRAVLNCILIPLLLPPVQKLFSMRKNS